MGRAIKAAVESSTAATMTSMSKSITETAKNLNKMGATPATTQNAVNKITEGMGTAGRNTANTMAGIEAGTTMTVEGSSQIIQSSSSGDGGGGAVIEKRITYPTGILE